MPAIAQPHCASCFITQQQLPARSGRLNLCCKCLLVNLCPACFHNASTSHSAEVCTKLQAVSEGELFRIGYAKDAGTTTLVFPTEQPRSTYMPLSTATSWLDYFTRISDKPFVAENIDQNLNPLPGLPDGMQTPNRFLQAATESSSVPLTILAALEKLYPKINDKTTLHLHILGADMSEMQNLMIFEELLHLLPTLSHLALTFVGPDVRSGSDHDRDIHDCCPTCTRRGRSRNLRLHQGKYHDYATTPAWQKPDLAVMFHSGHMQSETESWAPTIRFLVDEKIATVCTTYNEREMVEETENFRALGARFVVEGEGNRWKGMVAKLDLMEVEQFEIYYLHAFWFVVGGRA